VGILIDCPAVRIGLGENLDRPDTEPAVFINATDVGVGGLGVPAHVNPLDADTGNFDCGDTIIFQAVETTGTVGGVTVLSFVLDDDALASEVTGVDTFVNARTFLEEQTIEEQ